MMRKKYISRISSILQIKLEIILLLLWFFAPFAFAPLAADDAVPRSPCYGKDEILDPPGYKDLAERIWRDYSFHYLDHLSLNAERIRVAKALLALHEKRAKLNALLLAKKTGRDRLEEFYSRLDPQSFITHIAGRTLKNADEEIELLQKFIDGIERMDINAVRSQATSVIVKRSSLDDEYPDAFARRVMGDSAYLLGFFIDKYPQDRLKHVMDPYLTWHGTGMGIGFSMKNEPGSLPEELQGRCSEPNSNMRELLDRSTDYVEWRLLYGLDMDSIAELTKKVYGIDQHTEHTYVKRWKRNGVSYDAATKMIMYTDIDIEHVHFRIAINMPDAGFARPRRTSDTLKEVQRDMILDQWNAVRSAVGLPPKKEIEELNYVRKHINLPPVKEIKKP